MGFWEDWESCMDTMGMPTPSEIGDSVVEVLHKLHEIELALGGLSLHEAIEALEARGVVFRAGSVAKMAGGITVAWWSGNAVGCLVTAAIGNQIVDAIDTIFSPLNRKWIEKMITEVDHPIVLTFTNDEETSTSSSSTERDLFYLPYPGHKIEIRSPHTEDVRLVQSRLGAYGYVVDVTANSATTPALPSSISRKVGR